MVNYIKNWLMKQELNRLQRDMRKHTEEIGKKLAEWEKWNKVHNPQNKGE